MQGWQGWEGVPSDELGNALSFDNRRGVERIMQRDMETDEKHMAEWNLPVQTNSFVARVGSKLALGVLDEARAAYYWEWTASVQGNIGIFEIALAFWGRCMEKFVRIESGDSTRAQQQYRAVCRMWKSKNESKEKMPGGVDKWGLTYSPAPEQSAIVLKFLSEWHTPVRAQCKESRIDVAYMLYVTLPLVCFQIAVKTHGIPRKPAHDLSNTLQTVYFEHNAVWKWMQSIPELLREKHSATNLVMPAETPLRHFLKASEEMIDEVRMIAANQVTRYMNGIELGRNIGMPESIYVKMREVVCKIELMTLHLLRWELQVVSFPALIEEVTVKALPPNVIEERKVQLQQETFLGVQILLKLQYEGGCFNVDFVPKYNNDEASLCYEILQTKRRRLASGCVCPHCLAFGQNVFSRDSTAAFSGRMVTAAAVWVIWLNLQILARSLSVEEVKSRGKFLLETACKLPGVKLSLSKYKYKDVSKTITDLKMEEKEQAAMVFLLTRQTRAARRIVSVSKKWLQATDPQRRVTEEWKSRLKLASRVGCATEKMQEEGVEKRNDDGEWPLYQDFMAATTPIKQPSATPGITSVDTPPTEPMSRRKRVSASCVGSADSSAWPSVGA